MHTQHHDELKFVSGSTSYVQIFNGTRQDVKAENQLRHSNDIHLASNDTGQSGGCFLKFETPMILGYKLTFPDILVTRGTAITLFQLSIRAWTSSLMCCLCCPVGD
jgi:hypothetical protein